MDIVTESGRNNPVSKPQIFSLMNVENKQASAGRDGRTCLERPAKFSGANRDREKLFLIHLTTNRIGK